MVCRSVDPTASYGWYVGARMLQWCTHGSWRRRHWLGAAAALELHHEAAERRPVRHTLAPLPGAEAVGGRRRGRWGEALHHAALVAPAARARGRVALRVRRRRADLVRRPLLPLDGGVLLPDAELAGGADDLRGVPEKNITMLLRIEHTTKGDGSGVA